jgi:hypothetical protein
MSDALLQELLDREAIKELKARDFRLVDAQDWDAYRALFTDDAMRMDPLPREPLPDSILGLPDLL